MRIGIKKKVFGSLLAVFTSAVFAESDISVSHDIRSLESSGGKTMVSLGITTYNSGEIAFEDALIKFKGPVKLSETSSSSMILGAIPNGHEVFTIMDFVIDGDIQIRSQLEGEIYFSFTGTNEVGEIVTFNVNSIGERLWKLKNQ